MKPRFAARLSSALLRAVAAGALALAAALPSGLAATASAQATPSVGVGPFARGAVVALRGTQHLWVADDLGTLHWAADAGALNGRPVDWSSRTEVGAEQLVTLPRGSPWTTSSGEPPKEPLPAPAGAAPQAWAPLRTGGGFAVWAPAQNLPPASPAPSPQQGGAGFPFGPGFGTLGGPGSQGEPGQVPGVPSDVHVVLFGGTFDGPTQLFVAGSGTLPEGTRTQLGILGPDAAFEVIRAEMTRSERVRLLAYRSIVQGTHRGREISLEPAAPGNDPFQGLDLEDNESLGQLAPLLGAARFVPHVTITARVFIVGDKLYAAAAITAPGANPTGPGAASTDVARFLDSFQLLP